jgi:hypothetical protein
VAILFMKDASIKLKVTGGGSLVEYNGQVQSAAVEPEPGDESSFPTLDGNVAKGIGPASYSLVLTFGQDWSTTGFARFLFDNAGATLDFEYQAHGVGVAESASTPKVVGQCRAVPGNYGGEVGTFAEAEVSLPCLAKPTLDTTP